MTYFQTLIIVVANQTKLFQGSQVTARCMTQQFPNYNDDSEDLK